MIIDAKECRRRREDHLRKRAEREAAATEDRVEGQLKLINEAIEQHITGPPYCGEPVAKLAHPPHLYVKRALAKAGWRLSYAGDYHPRTDKFHYVIREQ